MLGFLLCIAVAHAAVIPNGTTEGTTTITRTATLPAQTPTSTIADGSWTYDFYQFITVAQTYDPNPISTPRPTTPMSHLYPEMYPIYALSRLPEKPFIGLASPYANSYAVQRGHTDSDAALRARCSTSFDKSLNPWLQTAPIGVSEAFPESTKIWTSPGFTGPTRATWSKITTTITSSSIEWAVYSAIPTTVTEPPVVVTDVYAKWTLWTYETPFTYSVADPDCCWTCTIVGGTHVQVNYWPKTPDPEPVATIVDSKGFTFVSPSVYVAFETLYATNLCGNVGPTYGATTIGFGATELSTARAYRWDFKAYLTAPPVGFYQGQWTQADWGDQTDCANTETTFYQWATYSTFSDLAELRSKLTSSTVSESDIHHYTVTWNNCSPSLSVPTQILTLNTHWHECSQGLHGVYDPPYALKTQGGLVSTTSADPITSSTTKAAASPTPPPVTPTPTAEPITEDPKPTPSPDPPIESPSKSNPPTSPTQKPTEPSVSPIPNDPETQQPGPEPTNPKPDDPPSQTQNPPQQSNGNPPTQPRPTTAAGVITVGSSTLIADPSSNFVIGTQTLAPGGQIVASGTTFSLATDGASLVVGGSTGAVSSAPIIRPTGYIVGSQTIAAGGPAITISGVEVSLAADASTVVVGGSSMPLSEYLGATTTTAEALGSIIASVGGFGTSDPADPTNSFVQVTSTPGYNGTMFTGGAMSTRGQGDVWVVGVIAAAGVMAVGIL